MLLKLTSTLFTAAMIAAFSTSAIADAHHYYIGGSIGSAENDESCDDIKDLGFIGSCDDRETVGKLFAGYQFNSIWGIEAFYTDLGEVSAKGTVDSVAVKADGDADGFGLAATANWSINQQFSLFAKLGFIRWNSDADAILSNTTTSVSTSDDDSGTDVMYGIGAAYSFTDNFALRLEFERFNDVADSGVDLFSAGIVYSF